MATQAVACSIPVFRYALENWRPDAYVAFVLHRGELTDNQQTLLETMQAKQFAGSATANLEVRTVSLDSAGDDEVTAALVEQYGDAALPQLILRKPDQRGASETVFSGELTADSVQQVMQSPLRAEITDRLIKGDSVVWVYLECGRQEVDDRKFAMLETELARLEKEIELPEIDEDDLDELAGDPESLEIKFSAVRLSRDNLQEAVFRDMLLHVEQDLMDADYIDEPMAFPVFGRGRALYALVGEGLAPDLVDEACRFLTGACQCTVKAENPGVDLMMQVEWDRFIKPTEAVDASLPPLAGFSGFGAQSDEGGSDMTLADNSATADAVQAADSAEPDPAGASSDAGTEEIQSADDAGTDTPNIDNTVTLNGTPEAGSGTGGSGSGGAIWQNSMYVLLLAGGGVVVATLLLMRRPGG